jgi:hypothetical protein
MNPRVDSIRHPALVTNNAAYDYILKLEPKQGIVWHRSKTVLSAFRPYQIRDKEINSWWRQNYIQHRADCAVAGVSKSAFQGRVMSHLDGSTRNQTSIHNGDGTLRGSLVATNIEKTFSLGKAPYEI